MAPARPSWPAPGACPTGVCTLSSPGCCPRRCMACCCSSRAATRRRAKCCARACPSTPQTRRCGGVTVAARTLLPTLGSPLGRQAGRRGQHTGATHHPAAMALRRPIPRCPPPFLQLCMEWALAEQAAGNLGELELAGVAQNYLSPPPGLPLGDRLLARLPARPPSLASTLWCRLPLTALQRMRLPSSSRARRCRSRMRRCLRPGPSLLPRWAGGSWQKAWSGSCWNSRAARRICGGRQHDARLDGWWKRVVYPKYETLFCLAHGCSLGVATHITS